MIIIEKLQTILILGYFFILVILALIAIVFYNKYCELKTDKKLSPGNWHGGTFFVNPTTFIPINDKTENKLIQGAVSRHKKTVILFWIWIFVLIPIIIILNLAD